MITLTTKLILTPELINHVYLHYSPSITLSFDELSLLKTDDLLEATLDPSFSTLTYGVGNSESIINYILIYSELSGVKTLTSFAVLSQPMDLSIVQRTLIQFTLQSLSIQLIQDEVDIASEYAEHASPSNGVIPHKYLFQDSTTTRITYPSDKLNSKIKIYPTYRQSNRLQIKSDYTLDNLDHKAVSFESVLSSNNVNPDDYLLAVEYYQDLEQILALITPGSPIETTADLIKSFTGITSNPIDGILIYTYVTMDELDKKYLIISGGGNNKEIHIYDVDLDMDDKTVLGLPQVFTFYDTIITSGKLCHNELYAFRSNSQTPLGTVNGAQVFLFTTIKETIITSDSNKYYLPDFFDLAYIHYELEGSDLFYQPFDHPRMTIAESNYLPSAFLQEYFKDASLATHRNVVCNYLLASLCAMRELVDNDQDPATVRFYDTFFARLDQGIIKIYPYSFINTKILGRLEIDSDGVEEIQCNGRYIIIKYLDGTIQELDMITTELVDAVIDEESSWYWYRGCKFKITSSSVSSLSDHFGDMIPYDYQHPSYDLGYS